MNETEFYGRELPRQDVGIEWHVRMLFKNHLQKYLSKYLANDRARLVAALRAIADDVEAGKV